MEFRYMDGNETYTLTLEPQSDGTYLVRMGDETYAVHKLDDGTLRINGRNVQVSTAHVDTQRWVNVLGSGHTHTLERLTRRSARRQAASAQGDLMAQMPGQVMDVLVEVGQAVEAGDTLLIIEAMKMEMRVTAPFDGTVTGLHVSQGQTVDRGHNLAEVTPAS